MQLGHGSGLASKTWLGFRAFDLYIQISKALLVRNHPDAMRFVDRLFEVFGDQHVGWDAARAIGEIGGTDKILTKRNHASIRVCILCETDYSEESDLFDRSCMRRNISTACCHA